RVQRRTSIREANVSCWATDWRRAWEAKPVKVRAADVANNSGYGCATTMRCHDLVAADVRRLTLFRRKKVRASLRRLLRFSGSTREHVPGNLSSSEEEKNGNF